MHSRSRQAAAWFGIAAILLAVGLVIGGPTTASAEPGPDYPAGPSGIQTNGSSFFGANFECFTLADGKNPGKIVRLSTSNFDNDRVTVGKSNMMCETAFRFDSVEQAFTPSYGDVLQCFRLDGGLDPARPVLLQTATSGELKATVGKAIQMCESAVKFREDRPPFGFPNNLVMECFSLSDVTPTSGRPAVLATNNFGIHQDEIRRLDRMCEFAVKFREGYEPFGFTGPVFACFKWGSAAELNQPARLQTRNFRSDDVTIVRANLMCEPAAKIQVDAKEMIIDADGFETATDGLPGARDPGLVAGAALSDFPTFEENAGLDWFDNDGNAQWTAGDDLISESEESCLTGIRNGYYDLGEDCKILDVDNSLVDNQQVSCDLEVDARFAPQFFFFGCGSPISHIRYFDANNDGNYEPGEDIILDANNDGVWNP